MQQFVDELCRRMNVEREKMVNAKLKEIGATITLRDQATKRFKDVICEVSGNEEAWYYNDGTSAGVRLITFVNKFPELDTEEGFSLKAYLQYY